MKSTDRPAGGFANSAVGLALLTACYIMAQAVTQVVGLLVVPLQTSLHATDTQMGLLQGFAFIFVYVLAGIPIARFIDRGDRLRMIAVCVFLFSVATILSGLARSFAVLVLLRAGTGIAEAAVPPAAFSLFSEARGARRVARATGTFMLAPFVGAGVAIAGGGLIIRLLPSWPLAARLGFDEAWRLVFLLMGVPGLFLAALVILLGRDQASPGTSASRPESTLPLLGVLRLVFVERPFFRSYHAAFAAYIMFLFGYIAWFPTFLIRRFGLALSEAGAGVGLSYMIGGIAGTLFSVAIAGRREAGGLRSTLNWFACSMLLTVPLALMIPLVPSVRLALLFYGCIAFLASSMISVMVVPIQIILPSGVQGRANAVFTFLVTAIGGTLGPMVIGLLSDHAGFTIGMGLMLNGFLMSSLAAILLLRAREVFGRDGGELLRKPLGRSEGG